MAKKSTKEIKPKPEGYVTGRPTKYKPEYVQEFIDYFSEAPYKVVNNMKIANDFRTIASFARKIGVNKDTLHEWRKVHPEFSDAYKLAEQYQEEYLSTNGTLGLINPAFSIFTAKNVINWRDKKEISGDAEKPLTIKVEPVDVSERLKKIKDLE